MKPDNSKFCICIPTYNRYDLLKDALSWYANLFPNTRIYILDNGRQGIVPPTECVTVFPMERNLGVAPSWNYLIKVAKSNFFSFLILNDDIILKKTEQDIAEIIDTDPNAFFISERQYHWSAFIHNRYVHDKIGEFDENFLNCYFEDNDYEYRMRLAGMPMKRIPQLNPGVYVNSGTIQKDPSLNNNYTLNSHYYVSKWGGVPGMEKFSMPFDRPVL
jgi:GT2 family glycosyltransferase